MGDGKWLVGQSRDEDFGYVQACSPNICITLVHPSPSPIPSIHAGIFAIVRIKNTWKSIDFGTLACVAQLGGQVPYLAQKVGADPPRPTTPLISSTSSHSQLEVDSVVVCPIYSHKQDSEKSRSLHNLTCLVDITTTTLPAFRLHHVPIRNRCTSPKRDSGRCLVPRRLHLQAHTTSGN